MTSLHRPRTSAEANGANTLHAMRRVVMGSRREHIPSHLLLQRRLVFNARMRTITLMNVNALVALAEMYAMA